MMILHWLTAAAVLIAYATSGDPTDAANQFDAALGQMHVASGFLVFALVALRLPLRALLHLPKALGPRWQQRAAGAAHLGLYALMLLVPLAGWAALADKTAAYSVLGVAIPALNAHAAWVGWLGEAHQTLGNVFIALVGVHALAALLHHLVLRDATLPRMLPIKSLQH
jgi:cytochrome b561